MPLKRPPAVSLAKAWEVPDLRAFLLGDTASKMGRAAFMTSVGWKVAELGGPKAFGAIMTAYFLGHLPLIMIGGMLVDRIPRRTVALAMDIVQAVLAALFILLLMAGFDLVNVMIFAAFMMGASSAFSMPAIQALVPDLVEEEMLSSATGLHNALRTAAWSVGGLIGGVVIRYSTMHVALLLDLISFLISAWILFGMEEVPIQREEEEGDFRTEMGEAMAFVISQPWLFIGIIAFMVFHIGGAVIDIGIPFIVQVNDWNAIHYGVWGAMMPIGASLGALWAGSNPISKERRGMVFYVVVGIAAWLDILYVFVPWFGAIMIIAIFQGLMGGVLGVIWNTTIGDSVDQRLRGRVNSIDMIGSFLFIPFAPLFGGYMIDTIGLQATFLIAVSIMVAATIVGVVVPSFRRFERIGTERFPLTGSQNRSD
jgi:MFS family permease